MEHWHDTELGKFVLTDAGWVGTCLLPTFKIFRYEKPGKSKLKLEFETEIDADEIPSNRAITIAKRIIANEATLSEKLIRAIFDDLNGKGLDSGMWWHGDTQSVLDFMDEPLRSKIDLTAIEAIPRIIGSPSIWIRPEVDDYEKPCAVILFESAFDPEHGLGVLTDGTKVLGIGYQMSVAPFFKYQYHA